MKNSIVFMGTPVFSLPVFRALIDSNSFEIVGVFTQPDKQAGRGQKISTSPVKEMALSHGIKIFQPETLKTAEAIEQIKGLNADAAVVSAYGKIIPENILNIPMHGCINIHPSLLPKYRGATPIPSAILNGDKTTGVSIMLLDPGMDTGPVFSQREEPISDEDTAVSLSERLSNMSVVMLMEVLPLWLEGKIKPQPQDDSKATYTKVISREDGRIDWNLSAIDIWRRVRALQPWPGCYTTWNGRNLKITKAVPIDYDSTLTGRVIALKSGLPAAVGVECGTGMLGIIRLQLEGKREMAIEEFIRGQQSFTGGNVL